MLRNFLMGAAAGAVGTVALDVTTYLDMFVRGRPASEVPSKTAEKLTSLLGVTLMAADSAPPTEKLQAESRQAGLGALLGYAAGLGVGAAYGAIRPSLGDAPLPLTGLALAAAAMAAGDLPPILTGTTNPVQWGAAGWISDLVPHLAYGFLTALAYEAFTGGEIGRRQNTPAEYLGAAARHTYARLRD